MFVKLMYNDNIFLRGAILLKLLEDRILKDGIVKPGNVTWIWISPVSK